MELYNQLQHLIGYVKNHTEAQQPDLMLGIYICEGIKNSFSKKFRKGLLRLTHYKVIKTTPSEFKYKWKYNFINGRQIGSFRFGSSFMLK